MVNQSISTYKSELTSTTPTYLRECGKGKYHYQIIELNMKENGVYSFKSNSTIIIYGYIYKSNFDPFNPIDNILTQSNYSCGEYFFEFGAYLKINTTYILVITTLEPYVKGEFSVLVIGPNNVSLNRICEYSWFFFYW